MNRLAGETSPYLLQHASNPVDWRPWGDEAFAEAQQRDVPLLVSIGYSACHWCHVMEHESFSDPLTARLMNQLYVNVKVDREERPDVDAVYMDAVVSMTGHGGWPMTVFLTPDRRPFYGGTYYPPEPRHGMPAFRQVLEAVSATWRERRDEVTSMAGRLTEVLQRAAAQAPFAEPLDDGLLEHAVDNLAGSYDGRWGGFGGAPKFPPASVIGFLLREHHRTRSAQALEMAAETLEAMALGGMYDVVGGGFHRYSVDARWLVPHFEKMLYDNALLAVAYLEGWAVTGNVAWRAVAESTLDYMVRELRLPEGGFASSQDADTGGVEGATYVWTPAQLRDALGADADVAIEHYGVTESGNFEGATILRPSGPDPDGMPEVRRRLLEVRAVRPQPGLDDKALSAWNGLALAALAQGGWRLGREDLVDAANGLAAFLRGRMTDSRGRLLRTYRAGEARIPGYLDDHAAVAHGLLELYTATGEASHLEWAETLADEALERFADPHNGGFFYTAADGEQMVAARKELDDNPTPSGNSLMATVLLRLARLHGDEAREGAAVGVLQLGSEHARRMPHGFGHLLQAVGLYLATPREVAVVGPAGDPATRALADAVRSGFHPNVVYAFGDGGPASLPLLAGRGTVDGLPAVYVCERFACQTPVTDPAAAARALAA